MLQYVSKGKGWTHVPSWQTSVTEKDVLKLEVQRKITKKQDSFPDHHISIGIFNNGPFVTIRSFLGANDVLSNFASHVFISHWMLSTGDCHGFVNLVASQSSG